MTREYHASVHSVDRNVGRILTFLDDTGLAKNTVVIVTSDQGYNMGHNGIWHKGDWRGPQFGRQIAGARSFALPSEESGRGSGQSYFRPA
ncbi:MAG: sulfatase-like hydrolase/transferase [Candidatus Brocadiia bacterium]